MAPHIAIWSQGLSWYKARLKQDADGDVAEQFWSEVVSPPTAGGNLTEQPKRALKVLLPPCI
jgi:uncharacterized protein YfaQ (DUF2300 family)